MESAAAKSSALADLGPVLAHQFSMLSMNIICQQPRAQLQMAAVEGDTTMIAKQTSQAGVIVGLSEFLLTPRLAALSDRIGRRPLMLAVPALTLPLKAAAALSPTSAVLLAERIGSDILRTFGGTTMAYICLADLFTGPAYTAALERLNMATGLGIVASPLVMAVLGPKVDPRWAYLLSALMAVAHCVVGNVCLRETLECHVPQEGQAAAPAALQNGLVSAPPSQPQQQQQLQLQPPKEQQQIAKKKETGTPLDFLRLFRSGPRLRRRALLLSLHCLVEGKVLLEQVTILQMGLGWDLARRSRWVSGMGLAMFAGGLGMNRLRQFLGEHGTLAACHLASLAAFLGFQKGSFWLGLLCLTLGQQRRSTAQSWVVKEACALGYGKGEVTGWTSGLRASIDVASAMLYHRVYQVAHGRGDAFKVFILPSLVILVGEVLRLRVQAEQPDQARQPAAIGAGVGTPAALPAPSAEKKG